MGTSLVVGDESFNLTPLTPSPSQGEGEIFLEMVSEGYPS